MRFAELKFQSLTKNEWMEAFAHHTPVGEKLANNKAFSAEEKENLEDSCRQYLRRFGHVFIIQTAGMKPKEILSQLRRRLKYDAYDELYVAGLHQSRITKGKLVTLLTELSRVDEVRRSEAVPIAGKVSSRYLKARGRQIASSADLAKKSA